MSKRTYKEIVDKAEQCKNNVEKKYKLGINVAWVYYICKAIIKPKTDITRIGTISPAPNPRGNHISNQIYKENYLYMAKRLITFVEENKKLPNFIRVELSGHAYKITVRDYIYMFSRILVYYDTHGALPKYANVNSNAFVKPTKKKYGHATEHCCDDMGQNNGYYCGCHSLQEVFRNLTGKVIPQSTIASVCGTTSDGTDHEGLNTCVEWFNRNYGYNLKVQWYNFSDLGWNGIKKVIDSNDKDCIIHNLYRNQWGHYEVINKVYDDYCDVQNSLGDTCSSGCYYGYVEERYLSTFRSYISGISQKSVMVITNE